jgi:hypothetical protein
MQIIQGETTMKKLITFASMLLLVAASLAAQSGNGTCTGNGTGTPALDPATLASFDGTVTAVNIAWGQGTPSATLQTADGQKTVLLGPIWFMDQNGFVLEAGDFLTVAAFTGSCSGQPCLIAKEVQDHAKGTVLAFRNDEGFPLWKGPRQKQAGQHRQGPDGQ